MSKYRRLSVALVAACLSVGLSAGPAHAAYSDPAEPTATAAQKKKATTESLRKRLVKQEDALRSARKTLNALNSLTKGNKTGLDFLLAAAPQLVTGLTQLRDASLQLKGGLETLGAAYTSVEYGAIRLYSRPAGGGEYDEISGAVVTSSDIPDDGNTATISASLPFQATGATDIVIRGTIRSNEQEPGVSTGEMGGVLYAKCIEGDGCDAFVPGVGTVANALGAGAVACTPAGPPDERSFSTPGGSSTDQSLIPVTDWAPRTDPDRPNIYDASPTGDRDDRCTLPGSGVYELTASVTFSDIPDTATPGPRE